ncbi:hypothetical protein OG978_13580 [Streptomyces sp. NBC_01591]|nr:hypothetical protein [Streptomyces sp. NBC_01591]WSD68345.1 hypothetical protein OG978_13580 [Streptomyces sp. NBC_01591]
MGARPADLTITATEQERLVNLVERLRSYAFGAGRWDLLIETLIALRGLNSANRAAEAAWMVRRGLLGPPCHGGVPLDDAAARQITLLAPTPRDPVLFRSCYHATLAQLLLQALLAPAQEVTRHV